MRVYGQIYSYYTGITGLPALPPDRLGLLAGDGAWYVQSGKDVYPLGSCPKVYLGYTGGAAGTNVGGAVLPVRGYAEVAPFPGGATVTIPPDVLVVALGIRCELRLELAYPDGYSVQHEFLFRFSLGQSGVVTLPLDVAWSRSYEGLSASSFDLGVTYEVSIVDGLGIITRFE